MSFSVTKNKIKWILLSLFTLIMAFLGIFNDLVAFARNKWIGLAIVLFLFLVLAALLVFDIRFGKRANLALTVTACFAVPLVSFECVELLQNSAFVSGVGAFFANLCIYIGMFLLIAAVSTQVKYAVFIAMPIYVLIGLVNHYVLAFRGTPMQPWDIAAAKTAMNVIDNFIFTVDEFVLSSILLTAVLICLAASLEKIEFDKKQRLIVTVSAVCVALLLTGIPYYFIQDNRGKFHKDVWNQTVSSERNGYVVNFLLNLQTMNNTPPEGYSVDAVNDLLAGYETDYSAKKKPNVIAIMNEAFADLNAVNDLALEQDYMPFVRSLQGAENAVTGTLDVSVFGGGTCNTEYEFLTSNVSSMLRVGSYPMQQFVNTESVSIASNLRSLGYKTVGLHPYYGSGWNRSRAYPLLGFDQFITIDDFAEDTGKIREYVSDEACYEKIIEVFDQTQEPLFLFAVTMQNHGGYETAWDDMPDDVSFAKENECEQTDRYLELAKLTDEATRKLIEYIDNSDSETIVLFFGDHQPSLGDEYGKLFPVTTTGELSGAVKKYQVPFFIWANYDIAEEQLDYISPNYLAPLLIEKAGLPQTAYYKYLNDLKENIPTITAMAYRDAKGNLFDANKPDAENGVLINQYDMLQYNNVFDKKNLSQSKFKYYY